MPGLTPEACKKEWMKAFLFGPPGQRDPLATLTEPLCREFIQGKAGTLQRANAPENPRQFLDAVSRERDWERTARPLFFVLPRAATADDARLFLDNAVYHAKHGGTPLDALELVAAALDSQRGWDSSKRRQFWSAVNGLAGKRRVNRG